MSIFNTNTTPVAPEVAVAQKLRQNALVTLNQLKQNYVSSYNQVWHNKLATADLIVAAIGTDAQQLFAVSAATAQLLIYCGHRYSDNNALYMGLSSKSGSEV